jgi:RimJ/RimL family protein N-acetyltransferase
MSDVIATGERILLRDRVPEDLDSYLRWMEGGQWREYDAPWEHVAEQSSQDLTSLRVAFLAKCEQHSDPRDSAIIALPDGRPLGWTVRYLRRPGMSDTWFLGIDLCEDKVLERGFGSEALKLWIDYLFANSEVNKLALDTWSFNERMMHVAEKLGFIVEGRRRAEYCWKGEWLDRVEYGLLRSEWEG